MTSLTETLEIEICEKYFLHMSRLDWQNELFFENNRCNRTNNGPIDCYQPAKKSANNNLSDADSCIASSNEGNNQTVQLVLIFDEIQIQMITNC